VLVVLAGALLLLVSTAGAWVTGVLAQPPPLPSPPVEVGAGEAAAPVRALGLVVLAAVPALVATRRTGRRLVGALLVLAGAAAGTVAARVLVDPAALVDAGVVDAATTAQPLLALVGSVVTAVGGAVVAAHRGDGAGLARRYEAPAARGGAPAADDAGPPGEPQLWDALDRGEDPTRT
jgi:uncharacterized membrane protein (TIGR02234 family)